MKISKLHDPILPREVTVLIGGTNQDKDDYLNKTYGNGLTEISSGIDGAAEFITIELKENDYILWIPDGKSNQELALTAHEVLHLTFEMLRTMGIRHCRKSEEIYTHYFQFFFMQILEILDTKPSKKSKK